MPQNLRASRAHRSPAEPAGKVSQPSPAPALPLMHAAFVLAGLGTMLLGPILPLLSRQWQLKDSQSGLLLLAQFLGATLGGASTSARLTRDLLIGLLAAAAGLFAFAFAPGLPLACAALFVAGFGIGRTIATINITAGNRYTQQRASALSWLNFSWSFGALLSPLAAAWLASRFALSHLLAVFALCFLLVATIFALQLRTAPRESTITSTTQAITSLAPPLFLFFAALIFLYGGLETCLSAWLTTYAVRYGQSSLHLSQYIMVLLLAGLTCGRALAGWLLLRIRDSRLMTLALLLSALLTAALAFQHRAFAIGVLAVFLGIALAPIFPAAFAIVMQAKPTARQAGLILAASGIGAAAFPELMGLLSTLSGSLRLALSVPIAAALLMLALSRVRPSTAPISNAPASV